MAGYLFTVKDRQTDEILCQGSAQECADFIGCKNSYIRDLTRKQPEYKINHKYSAYKVERQVVGEIKRGGAHKKDVICCDCGVLMVNACVKLMPDVNGCADYEEPGLWQIQRLKKRTIKIVKGAYISEASLTSIVVATTTLTQESADLVRLEKAAVLEKKGIKNKDCLRCSANINFNCKRL